MKKIAYKIDENGYIDWEHLLVVDEDEKPPEGYIDTPLPGANEPALYRPRWDGEKWVEDMTEEEIEELRKQSMPPTLEDRINALEMLMLEQILGGGN